MLPKSGIQFAALKVLRHFDAAFSAEKKTATSSVGGAPTTASHSSLSLIDSLILSGFQSMDDRGDLMRTQLAV